MPASQRLPAALRLFLLSGKFIARHDTWARLRPNSHSRYLRVKHFLRRQGMQAPKLELAHRPN